MAKQSNNKKVTIVRPAKINFTKNVTVEPIARSSALLHRKEASCYTFLDAKECRKLAKKLLEIAKYIEA